MSEAKLWKELDDLMGNAWHASRVESHATSAGIPDVDYYYEGDGHIELKFSKNTDIPNIRDSQVRWIKRRSEVGGKVYILTKMRQKDIFDPHRVSFVYLWHHGHMVIDLIEGQSFDLWFNSRINDVYWGLDRQETKTILSGERG